MNLLFRLSLTMDALRWLWSQGHQTFSFIHRKL